MALVERFVMRKKGGDLRKVIGVVCSSIDYH
jgi:hypothetical protein